MWQHKNCQTIIPKRYSGNENLVGNNWMKKKREEEPNSSEWQAQVNGNKCLIDNITINYALGNSMKFAGPCKEILAKWFIQPELMQSCEGYRIMIHLLCAQHSKHINVCMNWIWTFSAHPLYENGKISTVVAHC